jgi:hypothetical protein
MYNGSMSDNGFTPQNKVQELAYHRRGIKSLPDFERAMGAKPWKVARTTARYWWENGITEGLRLSYLQTMADFFGVSLNDLGG